MIKYVKNHTKKITYILVYSLDRFSRTGDNAIYISSQLKKQGISIIAVTQPIDVSTVSGVLQQNIQFIFSKYDNDLRREKCVAGMREKLLRGEWLGVAPIGYSYASAFRAKEQVIIINDDGKLVKKAFQWKAQEGISNVEIAERLCKLGLKISHKRLTELFRNPFYCGFISHNMLEGQVVKGKHPALISERLFLEVNELVKKNHHGYKCKEDDNLFMKGFIKCASCGTPYTGYIRKKMLKSGKELQFYYYKCNMKGCKCNRNSKQVHEDFKNILEGFQIRPEYIPVIKHQLAKTYDSVTEDDAETQKVIKSKITELKEKLEKLEERFAFGEIDRSLFEKLAPKLKTEIVEKEKELEKVEINLSNPSEQIERAVVIASKLADLWLKGDSEEKKVLQNILFPEGLIYDRKNDHYRTQNVNVVIELIRRLSEGYELKKEGQTTFSNDLSASVVRRGIEPLLPG